MRKGETEPQEGSVYKHPALRIGYVSQHATHHIGALSTANGVFLHGQLKLFLERHLEKTPIQYIQWRFQDGHDRTSSCLTLHHEQCAENAFQARFSRKRHEFLQMPKKLSLRSSLSARTAQNARWRCGHCFRRQNLTDTVVADDHGPPEAEEVVPVRDQVARCVRLSCTRQACNAYFSSFLGLDHRFNTWIPREDLFEKGFTKLVQQFDDLEASREGAGFRDTSTLIIRKHLEDIGLDGDIAQYNEISGLSGGA